MSSEASLASGRQQRLYEILARYLEQLEAGLEPDQAELLAGHPDLAAELREFFENQARLNSLAVSFRSVAPSRLIETIVHDLSQPAPALPPALPAGEGPACFGDYELLREIARGGMGVVYEARQVSLNRMVALKIILPEQLASAGAVRRFRDEARAAAHLDHPHIVPIYEIGEVQGQHYFTMKLIPGSSLEARLDDLRLHPPGSTARMSRAARLRRQAVLAGLLAWVARAVHHAHQRGVLHRDLKPGNVLLEGGPDTPAEQLVPLVTDFGLAKRAGEDGSVSQSQVIVGTPTYMAPEQAMTKPGGLTTGADVYSLGCILYELLTGRPPFVAETVFDTLLQAVEQPPVPPRQRNPHVAADLEAVCLKCLAKQPEDRYPTALALAEDLERFQAGEAISLRPHGLAERAWRWARRNRVLAALLLLLGVLVTASVVGTVVAAVQIAAARDEAVRNANKEHEALIAADKALQAKQAALTAVQAAEEQNHRLLVSQYVANGSRALDGGDLFGSLVWFGEALALDASDRDRQDGHRTRLATVLRRCPKLVQVWFRDELTVRATLSPDGRRVVLVARETAQVWDVASGKPVSEPLAPRGAVEWATFSPDGRRLVTANADGTARLWDLVTGKAVGRVLRHDQPVRYAVFSRDGSKVATASADRTARVWDVEGKPLTGPLKHDYPVYAVTFSRDGKQLVTATGDPVAHKGEVRVWDVATGKEPGRTLHLSKQVARWAGLAPDGKNVVVVGGTHQVRLWDVTNGVPVPGKAAILTTRGDLETGFSPDGTHVLKLEGPSVQLYDLAAGTVRGLPLLHGGEVQLAAFSPDGRLILTAGSDRSVRVWDAATSQPVTPPLRHGHRVTRCNFSRDGQKLLTVTGDGTVRVWELSSRELALPPVQLRVANDPRDAAPTALSPDGSVIAVADKDGSVLLRDAHTDRIVHPPWKLPRPASHMVFSPDGKQLAVAGGGRLQVWDVASGKPVTAVLETTGGISQLLFTPDSGRVAFVGGGDLQVWDAGTGAFKFKHKVPAKPSWALLALGPRGIRLAGADKGNAVLEVRHAINGKVVTEPLRHLAPVTHAAFSPDGKLLATATSDGTAHLWDHLAGQQLTPPLQHGQPLRQVVFSLDGHRLATVAQDRTIRVWDAADGQPLTPLLHHPDPIVDASFSPDGKRLVAVGKNGSARVWDLTPDDRDVADLLKLTRVLSGQSLHGLRGDFVPLETGSLREAWPLLRDRYPREFKPSAP